MNISVILLNIGEEMVLILSLEICLNSSYFSNAANVTLHILVD